MAVPLPPINCSSRYPGRTCIHSLPGWHLRAVKALLIVMFSMNAGTDNQGMAAQCIEVING
ncbi:MAG: hypothetical protein IPH94_21825 [Saprospiraceae bacterium]|nr:hypothetical protein [Saprospiraceae bacterium]